jgi:hypothetical protein
MAPAKKKSETERVERTVMMLPPSIIKQMSDFRWAWQLESRSEAARKLIEAGLRHYEGRRPPAKD